MIKFKTIDKFTTSIVIITSFLFILRLIIAPGIYIIFEIPAIAIFLAITIILILSSRINRNRILDPILLLLTFVYGALCFGAADDAGNDENSCVLYTHLFKLEKYYCTPHPAPSKFLAWNVQYGFTIRIAILFLIGLLLFIKVLRSRKTRTVI